MLQPTLDYVAVKKIEGPSRSTGGIHLPDSAKKETFTGEVVAVGPGRIDDCLPIPTLAVWVPYNPGENAGGKLVPGVKVGDVAVFNQFAGNKVKVEDVEYLILQADEVLAILPPKPADPIPESDR